MEYQVVQSVKGRDAGRYLVVLGEENGYLLLADGKLRPIERPKRKRVKHIKRCALSVCVRSLSNKSLRQALRCLPK